MDGQFRLKRDGANLQVNIADLSAIEAALRIKAETPGGEVTVLSMGPAKGAAVLQELFALGVDRVILLSDRLFAGADTLATTRTLAAAAEKLGQWDCILCGRRAMDAETGQIPSQLAAALQMSVYTNVQQLTMTENGIICQRRLENCLTTVPVQQPCVISLCEYTYHLRLPSIMDRRSAKNKQVEVLTAADMGFAGEKCGLQGSVTKVIHVDTKAPGLRKCQYSTAKELAQRLREVCL